MTLTNHKLLILLAVLLLAGCATGNTVSSRGQSLIPKSLAILGVTVFPEIESGQSPRMMTTGLRELIHEEARYRTLRSTAVELAMDGIKPGAYRSLLDTYAKNGTLNADALGVLKATKVPVELALITRVEQNRQTKRFKLEPLRNRSGVVLRDRERKVLITEREVQMRATLINVASGAVVWSRSYRSMPQTKAAFVRYSGSSFSGTLAASLVNTMTTGLKEPDWPAPASYQLTVQSLMREIVRNMP